MNQETLVSLVTDWVLQNSLDPDTTLENLDVNENLLLTGRLDSIGFMGLLAFVDSELDRDVDVSTADPADFSSILGLCKLALSEELAAQ